MRSARSLALSGAVLVGIGFGAWAVPTAQAQTTSPALATAWWSQQPLAQPVADGGFEIGWALEQEQSMGAVRLDTSGVTGGTVYLVLHEVGGSATDQGLAEVCVTTDTWTPANPGAYADRPDADCAATPHAELGRDAGTKEWIGDVTSLIGSGGAVSLVVRPVGKPLGDGSPATAPFSVQFDSAGLRIEDPGTPNPVTTTTTSPPSFESGGGTAVTEPAFSYPYVGPDMGTPFLPPIESPLAVTETTAVGPSLEERIALGPIDVTESGGRPWGRVLVLTPLSAGIGTLTAAGRRWLLDRSAARGYA